MKNILIVVGGGRPKGNTAQLVEAFKKGAIEAGHIVEEVSLLQNEIKGCLGCNRCRFGKPCIQRDMFDEMLPKIKRADCLVLASPLYFWTISARLKAFIERLYCLAEKDSTPPYGRYNKFPNKDCALLITAADNYFWTYEQVESYYKFAVVNYIGFHDKGSIMAGCYDIKGEPQIDKTTYLKEAYQFGKTIY